MIRSIARARSESLLALFSAALLVGGCSVATPLEECLPGEAVACLSACGPGSRLCDAGGSLGLCVVDAPVPCQPGETGSCTTEAGEGGIWSCSDECRVGPCEPACEPGEERECLTHCGAGRATCEPGGTFGPCVSWLIPECLPGEIERCSARGSRHRRCGEDCTFGPCRAEACTPGETAICVSRLCGVELCERDGSWSGCDMECAPGDTLPCMGGELVCTPFCSWGECRGRSTFGRDDYCG